MSKFEQEGCFSTKNADIELRTIIMITNNTDQKQSKKWYGIMYYIHGGQHMY